MTTHTPGPWAANRDAKVYSVARKEWNRIFNTEMPEYVASVGGTSKETSQANARLIAAAPEMLSLVRAMLRILDACANDAGNGNDSFWDRDGHGYATTQQARTLLARIDGAT